MHESCILQRRFHACLAAGKQDDVGIVGFRKASVSLHQHSVRGTVLLLGA